MVRGLVDKYYADVTRYTTSGSRLRWVGRADETMRLGATDGTIWVKTVRSTALLNLCTLTPFLCCPRGTEGISSPRRVPYSTPQAPG
jgi:hypothetical protein